MDWEDEGVRVISFFLRDFIWGRMEEDMVMMDMVMMMFNNI